MPVATIVLIALTAASPPFQPPELALAVQAGRFAGGLGIDALFYHPLPAGRWPLTLSAYLGAGLSGELPRAAAVGGGIGVSLGWRHRAVVTLGWGTIGRSTLALHGTDVAERSLYGPDAAAGYELVSERGFVLRALAGASYLPRAWRPSAARLRPTVMVALGWMLW
jgi:hypothetical protein